MAADACGSRVVSELTGSAAAAAARHRRQEVVAGRIDLGAARPDRPARPEAQCVHPARRRGGDGGAKAAEAEIIAGRPRGPLHGVPVGIKDIIDVAGLPTTCHSKILIDNVAAADAVCVAKAARRRRDRARQALDPRIRDRRPELRPAVAAGAQPVEPGPSSRRLVVGLGRRASPPACSRWRSAATPAAASATRRAPAASSGSSRPTASCRAAASFRCPSPSTMSGR